MSALTSALPHTRKRKGARPLSSDDLWGFLFITPQLVGLVAFTLFPVGMSLYLCFARWDFINPPPIHRPGKHPQRAG